MSAVLSLVLILNIVLIYIITYKPISFNFFIELPGPGYQNVINREDYKLQYSFELISYFNQLLIRIYLFNSFPITGKARKIDVVFMIVYAH